MGAKLGKVLREILADRTTGDVPRLEWVKRCATAVSLDAAAVEELFAGADPAYASLASLEDLAEVFDVPVRRLREAAQLDGADYSPRAIDPPARRGRAPTEGRRVREDGPLYLVDYEVREHEGQPIVAGSTAPYDQPTEIFPGFREVVRRGAFTKTLQEGDPVALWQHNPELVFGRRSAGTLELDDQGTGLEFRAQPGEQTWASDALISLRRGDVNSSSFGFSAVRERFTEDEGGALRELLEVELFDVSPVTFAAYSGTVAEVRSGQIVSYCEALARHGLTGLEKRARISAHELLSRAGAPGIAHPPARVPRALRQRELELLERA